MHIWTEWAHCGCTLFFTLNKWITIQSAFAQPNTCYTYWHYSLFNLHLCLLPVVACRACLPVGPSVGNFFLWLRSNECNGVLLWSSQWNWWCLGCQVIACVSNIERYHWSDWVLDTGMRFVDTFILAQLCASCLDWWTTHTENGNTLSEAIACHPSHS